MKELQAKIAKFVKAREWEQFHSPKNLSMALSVETSELVEHFQWLTEEESYNLPPDKIDQVREEIGDVLIYLVELSHALGIDLLEAARTKLEINKGKYPASLVRGRALKYSEY